MKKSRMLQTTSSHALGLVPAVTPFAPDSIRRLLDTQSITTDFQPIFSVRQKCVVGMEALARGISADGRIVPPDALFKMAAAEGLRDQLEDV